MGNDRLKATSRADHLSLFCQTTIFKFFDIFIYRQSANATVWIIDGHSGIPPVSRMVLKFDVFSDFSPCVEVFEVQRVSFQTSDLKVSVLWWLSFHNSEAVTEAAVDITA